MQNTSGIETSSPMFNPFPGLRPFGLNEAHLFFGREGQSEEIVSKLIENRFVAVVGASGSGKSSLMYCGIVPLLMKSFSESNTEWNLIVAHPGSAPIKNLADAIEKTIITESQCADNSLTKISAVLYSNTNGLVQLLKPLAKDANRSYILLINQFEELFRFSKSRTETVNESNTYIDLLTATANQTVIPIYIVLTMRSDFVGECSHYQYLTNLINKSYYLVPQMSRDNLRSAIEEPIAVAKGIISERLVSQLLNEVGDNPDQLPILQHALMRTWEFWMKNRQHNEPIDITHYEAVGRMEKALSQHANEAYSELSVRGQKICESMFKTLTERAADNRGMRRPTKVKEIAQIADVSVEEVIEVIEKIRVKGRSLLYPAPDVVLDSEKVIDISHESLMRIWDRLTLWVDEEAASMQMYLRLCEASERYHNGTMGLWRQPDLQLALNWRQKQQPTKKWAIRYHIAYERTMVYLSTCEKGYIAEENHKMRMQRASLQRSRTFALVLGVATVVSLAFMLYSMVMKVEADKQRNNALEQSRIAEQQKNIAVIQTNEARKQREKAFINEQEAIQQKQAVEREKENVELQRSNAENNAKEAVTQKDFANKKSIEALEQRQLALVSTREALEQKQLAENASKKAYQLRMLSIAQSMSVKSQQINNDNNLKSLVALQAFKFNQKFNGEESNPDIYNGLYSASKLLYGNEFYQYSAHTGAVRALVYNDKTQMLYSAGSDGKLIRWDLKRNDKMFHIISIQRSVNRCLGLSHDRHWLACGNEANKVLIFDLKNTDNKPITLDDFDAPVISLHYTPDDKFLVIGTTDSLVQFRDTENEGYAVFSEKSIFPVKALAISPTGKNIAAVNEQGEIYISGNDSLETFHLFFRDSKSNFSATCFDKKGKTLATGDDAGNVMLFDIATKKMLTRLTGHHSRITDLKFSPDNSTLASASFDGSVLLHKTTNYNLQPIVFKDDNSWVWAITFIGNGNELMVGYRNNNIQRWYVTSVQYTRNLCDLITRNLTQAEWIKYVGDDIPYEKTCDSLSQKK